MRGYPPYSVGWPARAALAGLTWSTHGRAVLVLTDLECICCIILLLKLSPKAAQNQETALIGTAKWHSIAKEGWLRSYRHWQKNVRYSVHQLCCASEQGFLYIRQAKNAGKESTATVGLWRMSFLSVTCRTLHQLPRRATGHLDSVWRVSATPPTTGAASRSRAGRDGR
jgi:hypothetical protein